MVCIVVIKELAAVNERKTFTTVSATPATREETIVITRQKRTLRDFDSPHVSVAAAAPFIFTCS